VPTTAPKDSDVWKSAFTGWKRRWAVAGVTVDDSGDIKDIELEKAMAYNERFISGRLGAFLVDNRPLADIVIKQLKDAIEKRFPDHMVIEESTPLQKELDQQAQFLRVASEGFIERSGDFDALGQYLRNDDNRPLAVTAHAGMGKTSLLAHFIDTFIAHNGESLHYRFIGGSDDSVSVERLLRSLLGELKQTGKISSEIPSSASDMINKLPDLLSEAGKNSKTILVIDALNQLESGMSDLYWIPTVLPEGVKLIISFKRGEESADEYFQKQEEVNGMDFHSVKPFNSAEDRKALVSAYLEQYFKELDEPRIQALIKLEGAENPLFLKATLSELRVFGVHNDLAEVIHTRFGNTPVMAFKAILSRMESDPVYTSLTPDAALPYMFGWIAHSRYGLSVEELADLFVREELTGSRTDALDAIYLILRQLRPFLAKRDGRVDFFYESFKIAAAERYTRENKHAQNAVSWHKSLAEYFETLPLENRHKLMEQAWQYVYSNQADRLRDWLLRYEMMNMRLSFFDIDALINDYDLIYSGGLNWSSSNDFDVLASICECLTMSAHVLSVRKEQLATQLWGRLADFKEPLIRDLLQQAISKHTGMWLRPQTTCLTAPGGSLLSTISGNGKAVKRIVVNEEKDQLLISYADNTTNEYDISNRRRPLKISGSYNSSIDTTPPCVQNSSSLFNVSIEGNMLIVRSLKRNKSYKIKTTAIQKEYIKTAGSAVNSILVSRPVIRGTLLSPDGTRVFLWIDPQSPVAPVSSYALQLWDLNKRKRLRSFEGHIKQITGASFLSDSIIATSSEDNTIRIWDIDAGVCKHTLTGHTAWVNGLIVPGSGEIISWSNDSTVKIWDWKRETTRQTAGHTDDLSDIRTQGGLTVTASRDGSVYVWDMSSMRILHRLNAHQDGASTAVLSPQNKVVITGGLRDGCVKIWDLKDTNKVTVIREHDASVQIGKIKNDCSYFVTESFRKGSVGGMYRVLRIIDMQKNEIACEVPHFNGNITPDFAKIAFSDNHKGTKTEIFDPILWYQLIGQWRGVKLSKSESDRLADLAQKNLKWISLNPQANEGDKDKFAFTIDSKYFLEVCSIDGRKKLRVWDLADASVRLISFEKEVSGYLLTANKDLLIASFQEDYYDELVTLRLINIKTGESLAEVEHLNATGIAFSNTLEEHSYIPVISKDRHEISILDIYKQEILCTQYSEFPFAAAQICAETGTLIAGTKGGTIYFFKIENFVKPTRYVDI